MKGQATPVRAWPMRAKKNLVSLDNPSDKYGNELRKQRRPPVEEI